MKKTNFLKLGVTSVLLAAGLAASSVNAATDNEEFERKISQDIHQLIKDQQDKGFLKSVSELEVKIAKPQKIISSSGEEFEFPPNLNENTAYIIKNACKAVVTYSQQGDVGNLIFNEDILNTTQFHNETQKEMMREFLALHESFHCEIADIENPIMIEGGSEDFNKKMNYYLKDLQGDFHSNRQTSYFGTLSETFADIGATGILLKKYGEENPDLQFVLKAVETQRHAGYFIVQSNNHFTHLGMENALDNNAVKRLISAKDGNEYREVVLEIANKSVQQLITQRKDIAEEILSQEQLKSSVSFHLAHQIFNNSSNPDQNPQLVQLFRKDEKERGFVRDIVSDFFQGEERMLEKFKDISSDKQKDFNKLSNYVAELYAKKNEDIFLNRNIKQFDEYMSEFKETIFKKNEPKLTEFDNVKKEDVADRMLSLRNKFLASTKSNSLKIN